MKAVDLDRSYNPKEFEDKIYSFWVEGDYFSPSMKEGEPFVIVIPPPNVTGVLHMGHGLNNSLQDILIRYYRMLGRPALWLPGTDHAGIATQNVVERRLRQKGLSRRDLGREKFIEETWKVKDEHHSTIIRQLKKIGSSCDWNRERFTLDEGLSQAVREVFVSLYERGLIYRGNYLVNWCTSCSTALSDDEVEHKELEGKLYHFRYPFADGSGFVEIATTRPETMLGDTAVAVHPEDPRYSGLTGKMIRLPLAGRDIPLIADTYVDREFGTGALKITPAHDPNDWELAERHGLEKLNILNDDGSLNENVPLRYRGMIVKDARLRVIEDMKKAELMTREETHPHQVGHCYRCDSVIEPYLSEQWFVSMRSMADKALKAWEEKEVVFYPKRWENTYTHWLKGIRDWCISRQLWWGHRIPVWYCGSCGKMSVSRTDITECLECGSRDIRQDEDVLDTWFSSWLWPFSTLGWPEKTEDLERFFPTSALVTGYDIIFFWVARMIMASMEFMGKAPFRDIYITGLVRDKHGKKMSKSMGNGIDPLDVVDEYGADSMKFTLAYLAAQGQDVLLDKESFRFGSKFANKIWNAARFLLMNLEGRNFIKPGEIIYADLDRWIYHRLNEAVKTISQAMTSYRFNDAAQGVYDFFWNDFCDWYIEASKLSLYSDDENEKDRAISLLLSILEESLRLLHPFLSFITEEIYQKLPEHLEAAISAPYPVYREDRKFPETEKYFSSLQELIRLVRTLRSEFAVAPEKKFPVQINFDTDFAASDFIRAHESLIVSLVNADSVSYGTGNSRAEGAVPLAGNGFEVLVFIRDVIDVPKETAKLGKEKEKVEKLLFSTEKKLANAQFMSNAPEDVIIKERSKLEEFRSRSEKIQRYIRDLSS